MILIFNDYWAPKKSWVHQENRNPSKVSQYLANQPRQLRMSIISCFHQLENSGRVWKWWNQNCMYLGFFPNWRCLSFWVSISWETLGWLENSNEFPADWDFANTQKPALGRILPLNLNGPKCYLFRCGDLHLITATYNYSPSVTLFFFLKKTLSSTFPLYKVKKKSPVEQLINKNLVLNRNKVLRARKKKDVDCFQTGILCLLFEWCDVFLSPFIFAWSLVDSYKKKELLSDDSSGNCRTSYKPK